MKLRGEDAWIHSDLSEYSLEEMKQMEVELMQELRLQLGPLGPSLEQWNLVRDTLRHVQLIIHRVSQDEIPL